MIDMIYSRLTLARSVPGEKFKVVENIFIAVLDRSKPVVINSALRFFRPY